MSPPVRATAVKEGRRLVLVASKGDRNAKGMQVYLAESLGQWLGEQKVDGAGRPYGETKDEDPTLRKHFTRAQAVLARTPPSVLSPFSRPPPRRARRACAEPSHTALRPLLRLGRHASARVRGGV